MVCSVKSESCKYTSCLQFAVKLGHCLAWCCLLSDMIGVQADFGIASGRIELGRGFSFLHDLPKLCLIFEELSGFMYLYCELCFIVNT